MKTVKVFALVLVMGVLASTAFGTGVSFMPNSKSQYLNANGVPLSGGKIYTCEVGTICGPGTTTNLKSTFTDSIGRDRNTNPIVLDSSGRAASGIWLKGYYKIALYTSEDVNVWTVDNVSSMAGVSDWWYTSADSSGGIEATVAAIGSVAPVTMLVDTPQMLTNSLTITPNISTIVFNGNPITISEGKTLTINGPYSAGLFTTFNGMGTVVFGINAVTEVCPEWFGAVGNGVADDGPAINRATASLTKGVVRFQNKVYLDKSVTLLYKPFVNWTGSRGTTADSDGTYGTGSSRGTIIRAHADLYNSGNAGVLVYISAGDVSIRDMSFVGAAAISGNPSIGIQFGSSNTSRSFETGSNSVSGVNMENLSFFAFTRAWEVYSLNDSFMFNPRFETNTTGIVFAGTSQLTVYGPVMYGASTDITFANTATQNDIRFFGGQVYKTANGSNGIVYINTTAASSIMAVFYGTQFASASALTNVSYLFAAGNYDSGKQMFRFEGCTFNDGQIYTNRGSGSGNNKGFEFANCNMTNMVISLGYSTQFGFQGGRYFNTALSASGTSYTRIQGVEWDSIGTAITTTDANCIGWMITGNSFLPTVTTPVSFYDHPANMPIIKDNYGMMARTVLLSGTTSFSVCGKNGYFVTNNSVTSALANMTGGYVGQTVSVEIGDANTTIDFTSGNLKGNAGANWLAPVNSIMQCTYNGANWICLK